MNITQNWPELKLNQTSSWQPRNGSIHRQNERVGRFRVRSLPVGLSS